MSSHAYIFKVWKVSALVMFIGLFSTLYWYSNWSNQQSPVGIATPQFDLDLIPVEKRLAFQVPSVPTSKSKATYLNYWAYWCAPCLKEIPQLVKFAEQFRPEEVQFLFINMDTNDDDIGKARMLMANLGVKDPSNLFLGHTGLKAKLNVSGLPLHMLIDRQERVATRFVGDLNQRIDELTALVQALLAESPATRPEQ